VFNAHLTV